MYKQQLNEASFSYGYGNADQPKTQLAKFKGAKSDYKNSTAINTASLPGGTRQVNLAGMGSSADMSNEDEEIEKMRNEAKANEATDKIEKDRVEKVNQADALIFQSEKQLKEYGEKLSESNKTAIESALSELKIAHASQDLTSIDSGIEKLNTAWTGASQEMYANTQEGGDQPQQNTETPSDDSAEDVAFEEVK